MPRTIDDVYEVAQDTREKVIDLHEKFVDLKKHVNDELEVQKETLALKADKNDLTLLVLWKQSPTWLKWFGAAVTAASVVGAAVAQSFPAIPLP